MFVGGENQDWRDGHHPLSMLGPPFNSSVGKESSCNVGDPGSIPGSRRFAAEGIGYPLQYSWASFVAQLVKNSPAILETWVRSLGWEDLLEKGKPTHSCILAWRVPWTVYSMGVTKSQTQLSDFHFHSTLQKPSRLAFLFSQTNKQLDICSQRESYLPGRDETGIGDTPKPYRRKRNL